MRYFFGENGYSYPRVSFYFLSLRTITLYFQGAQTMFKGIFLGCAYDLQGKLLIQTAKSISCGCCDLSINRGITSVLAQDLQTYAKKKPLPLINSIYRGKNNRNCHLYI